MVSSTVFCLPNWWSLWQISLIPPISSTWFRYGFFLFEYLILSRSVYNQQPFIHFRWCSRTFSFHSPLCTTQCGTSSLTASFNWSCREFFYLRHSQKEGFLVMHLCTLLFSSVQLHSGVHLFNVGWISGPQYREGHSARSTQELWTKACSDGREWDPAPTQPPAKQKVIDILRNTQHYIPINNRVTVLIDWLRTFTLIISRVVLLALSWRFPSLTEFSVNAP